MPRKRVCFCMCVTVSWCVYRICHIPSHLCLMNAHILQWESKMHIIIMAFPDVCLLPASLMPTHWLEWMKVASLRLPFCLHRADSIE